MTIGFETLTLDIENFYKIKKKKKKTYFDCIFFLNNMYKNIKDYNFTI